VTQEFHISVTPVGESEYLVRTEKVEPGVPLAEEQVVWSLGDWLSQARQLMNNPLIGLLQGGTVGLHDAATAPLDAAPVEPLVSLMDLGQQLYGSLFQGILRDSWMTAQGIAQHRSEVLRLRLGLKGPLLPKLPWEVMHSGRDGMGLLSHPLSTGTHILFSRYQPGTAMARPVIDTSLQPMPTLRILMAIAAPTDQVQLQLKREASHLQQELRLPGSLRGGLTGALPDIQLTILEQPSREELAQALEQGQYQILHYAGHSNLDAAGGHLYLVNQRTGLTETLSGDDLAGLLVNNGIRMAVFNSCRGASSAVTEAEVGVEERSLTDALVSRGIPAVLAMAEQIPDEVALTLTRLFYRNLKQGYPVDLSLSRARQGLLSAYGSNQLYWALPTLYLHPDFNGYLTGRDRLFDNPADSLVQLPQARTTPASGERDLAASQATDVVFTDSVYLHPLDDGDLEISSGSEDEFLVPEGEVTSAGTAAGTEDGPAANDPDDESLVAELIHQLSQSEEAPSAGEQTASGSTAIAPSDRQSPTLVPNAGRRGFQPAAGALATAANNRAIESRPAPQPDMILDGPQAAVIRHPQQSWLQSKRVLLPLLGAAGVAIALVGYQISQLILPPNPDTSPVVSDGPVAPLEEANWEEADAETVADAAMYHFSNGQLQQGQEAVQALIERGELEKALDAMNTVPDHQISEPQISFLQGRLAWESIKQGETDFSVQDARLFWEYAARKQPSPSHYNALGFALYTEGNIEDAVDVWLQTLDALQKQGVVVNTSEADDGEGEEPGVSVPDQQVTDLDALTAYAGIALALAQLSANPSPDQPANLLSKALKIQQMVMLNGQGEFEADRLEMSWIWTDAMVREWRLLSQLRAQ